MGICSLVGVFAEPVSLLEEVGMLEGLGAVMLFAEEYPQPPISLYSPVKARFQVPPLLYLPPQTGSGKDKTLTTSDNIPKTDSTSSILPPAIFKTASIASVSCDMRPSTRGPMGGGRADNGVAGGATPPGTAGTTPGIAGT